jgi:hypothetical protein
MNLVDEIGNGQLDLVGPQPARVIDGRQRVASAEK